MLWFKNKKPTKKRPVDEVIEPGIKITEKLLGKRVLFKTAINEYAFSAGWVIKFGNVKEGKIVNINNTGKYVKIDDCWYEALEPKKGFIYWVIVLEILETQSIRDYVRPKPMINLSGGYQPEDKSGKLDRSNPPTGGSGYPTKPPGGHGGKSHD